MSMQTVNVPKLVAELSRMSVPQLRERYESVFNEPARSNNKQHLLRRIAWRVQALAEGDLSERTKARAAELARDADLRVRPPKDPPVPVPAPAAPTVRGTLLVPNDERLPAPGTLLRREYKGRQLLVKVLESGFEFEGEVYRTLSAIANKVTGGHWNGWAFFGVTPPSGRCKEGTR